MGTWSKLLSLYEPVMRCSLSHKSQVIAAEGEQKASRALREAAETIADSHGALQVRKQHARQERMWA